MAGFQVTPEALLAPSGIPAACQLTLTPSRMRDPLAAERQVVDGTYNQAMLGVEIGESAVGLLIWAWGLKAEAEIDRGAYIEHGADTNPPCL